MTIRQQNGAENHKKETKKQTNCALQRVTVHQLALFFKENINTTKEYAIQLHRKGTCIVVAVTI